MPVDKRIKCKRQLENKQKRKEKKDSEASKRGRSSRNKGLRAEREFVKWCKNNGIEAEKVPGGGIYKHINKKHSSDVVVKDCHGLEYRVEIKYSGSSFDSIYKKIESDEGSSVFYICDMDEQGWTGINMVLSRSNYFIRVMQNIFFPYRSNIIKNKGFSAIQKFFDQDKADIVAIKAPWKDWLFFTKESIDDMIQHKIDDENF